MNKINLDPEVEFIEKISESKEQQKIWNYYLEETRTEKFLDKINKLREKYQIPEKGFKDSCLTIPPTNWAQKVDYMNMKIASEIYKDLTALCKEIEIPSDWWDTLEIFMFYGERKKPYPGSHGLAMVSDLVKKINKPYETDIAEEDNNFFPIAIKISPHASRRDIEDFIKRTYSLLIKPLQEKYKDKNCRIGKSKQKIRQNKR